MAGQHNLGRRDAHVTVAVALCFGYKTARLPADGQQPFGVVPESTKLFVSRFTQAG